MRLAVVAANSRYFYVFLHRTSAVKEKKRPPALAEEAHRQPATKMKRAYQNTRSAPYPQLKVIRA
jgi:hypothetical protein